MGDKYEREERIDFWDNVQGKESACSNLGQCAGRVRDYPVVIWDSVQCKDHLVVIWDSVQCKDHPVVIWDSVQCKGSACGNLGQCTV